MRSVEQLTLREKLGQCFVAGFPGPRMSEEFVRLVKEYKVGNVILFQHNIESEEQLETLCAEIRALVQEHTGIEPWITIDQEGGVVTRLPESDVNLPGAMALAATSNVQNAYTMGKLTAQRLLRYGINFDLAPVVDINCNPDNPVIGVRSYSDDPHTVADYASAMMHGLLDGGVYASLKHFPGHGDTAVDSHLGLPRIDRTLEQLEQRELIPFRAGIAAGAPAITSAHVLFPHLEPDNRPATMSRTILTDLLRTELGFEGLIVSDCMEMQAIQSYYGTVNGALEAMKAGVDLVFISHNTDLAAQAVQRAEQAVQSGELSAAQLDESVARLLSAKRKVDAMARAAQGDAEIARTEAERVRAAGIVAVHLPEGGMPALGENPLFLGCRDYRSTIASNSGSSGFTFAEEMHRFAGKGTALVTPKDPTAEEIDAIVHTAQKHSCIVLGTYNGHILRGQLALAHALAALERPMILVALRNPYDLDGMPDTVATVAAWEYTRPLFAALWPILAGEVRAPGTLPLHSLRGEG